MISLHLHAASRGMFLDTHFVAEKTEAWEFDQDYSQWSHDLYLEILPCTNAFFAYIGCDILETGTNCLLSQWTLLPPPLPYK